MGDIKPVGTTNYNLIPRACEPRTLQRFLSPIGRKVELLSVLVEKESLKFVGFGRFKPFVKRCCDLWFPCVNSHHHREFPPETTSSFERKTHNFLSFSYRSLTQTVMFPNGNNPFWTTNNCDVHVSRETYSSLRRLMSEDEEGKSHWYQPDVWVLVDCNKLKRHIKGNPC